MRPLLGMLLLVAPAAVAQTYPAKPVRLIVPFAPGGGVDFTSRILAQKLSELWGQQAIVDNRLHPAVPVKSIGELIAPGKQKPGLLTFGTGGTGTSNHLSGELFGAMAGVKLRHIPYKVGAQATSDLMGGQLDVMFDNLPTSLPHVRAGKLRGLAVTSATRSSAAPELPTVAESGLRGYDVTGWVGVLVPAQTPGEIVSKLHADIAKVLAAPDAKERFLSQGAEAATSTPQQFGAFVRAEIEKWASVIRKAGITAQ